MILPKVGYPSGGRIVHVVGGVGYLSRRLGPKVRTAAEESRFEQDFRAEFTATTSSTTVYCCNTNFEVLVETCPNY